MSSPTLEALCDSLPKPVPVPSYRYVAPDEVPEPFQQLLVHDRHMTMAMETYHHCNITVKVLQRKRNENWYSRQILLLPFGTDKVVQGGLVRIHLPMLDPAVQTAILREDTPLGHVLIDHDVLRHIDIKHYLKFEPGPALKTWPGFTADQSAYGRLGILYCDLQPAIELFEIVPGDSLVA
jgi:hypothetical protein